MIAHLRHEEQRLHITLLEHIFQFCRAVYRVDRDQHQPGFSGGKLKQKPFRQVGRPHRDVISLLQTKRHQPTRYRVNARAIFRVIPANIQRASKFRIARVDDGFATGNFVGAAI